MTAGGKAGELKLWKLESSKLGILGFERQILGKNSEVKPKGQAYMASDRGQNRQSDFVASESLVVVVFLSSWRDLSLFRFVSSSFPVSSYCFLRGVISVSSCRQVSRFVVLLSSWRCHLLCFVVLFSSWRRSSLRVVVFFVSSTTV